MRCLVIPRSCRRSVQYDVFAASSHAHGIAGQVQAKFSVTWIYGVKCLLTIEYVAHAAEYLLFDASGWNKIFCTPSLQKEH